jgi:type IV secretion system protein TrbI
VSGQDGQPTPPGDFAAELRLRPERPPVTRLSRRVLTGLAAVGVIAISTALIWALYQGPRKPTGGAELYNTDNKPTPDGLAALPKDYAGPAREVPKLGPPLPGDLGRPIVSAQREGAAMIDPAEQRLAQEQEAARLSRLFATAGTREQPTTPIPAAVEHAAEAAARTVSGAVETALTDPDSLQNMQERKLAFLNAAVDRKTVSPDRLANPPSRYVVQAGSVISAALVTGIRSDLPGQVTAQVTENVFDSPTGKYRLIPQGSRLIGVYDSQVAFGQDRVLLVWTRLIMPNGRSIVLERQTGTDSQGFAGLEDEVDYHWSRLFMGAALSTLLGVGSQLGANNNDNTIVQALRRGSSDSASQAGQQVVRRNLNIQPTLTIRPGFPVRVMVNRDMVLTPYQGDGPP